MIRRVYANAPRAVTYPRRALPRRAIFAALFRRVECLFVIWALLVFAGAVTTLSGYAGLAGGAGPVDSPKQMLFPPIYLFSAGILLLRPARLVKAALRNTPTVMLTGLALVSYFWSATPSLTVKRGGMLVGLTLFALHLATRFDQRELLRLLGWALGFVAVASAALALLDPGAGIARGIHRGAWVGIYADKNALGRYMAVGVIVFASLGVRRARASRVAWLGAVLCAALVVLSRSATALVGMACAIGVIALAPIVRQRGLALFSVVMLALPLAGVGAVLALANFDLVVGALGREVTLSGRIPLWNDLMSYVWERPLLGSGYEAFWTGASGRPKGLEFESTGQWDVWHAHNGILELALQLGLVGVLLFAVGYVLALRRALQTLRRGSLDAGFWPVAFLVFLLVTSVGETMLLRHLGFYWIVYLAVVFSLVRPAAPQRPARPVRARVASRPALAESTSASR